LEYQIYNFGDLLIKLGSIKSNSDDDLSTPIMYIVAFEYILKPENSIKFLIEIITEIFNTNFPDFKKLKKDELSIFSSYFCSQEFSSEIINQLSNSNSYSSYNRQSSSKFFQEYKGYEISSSWEYFQIIDFILI
jgi:hypothetical protein